MKGINKTISIIILVQILAISVWGYCVVHKKQSIERLEAKVEAVGKIIESSKNR